MLTEMLVLMLRLTVYVLIPTVLAFAYRGWKRNWTTKLPPWRGTLGSVSVVLTVLSWFAFVISLQQISLAHQSLFPSAGMSALALLAFPGLFFAFFWRGLPRLEAVFAALLTIGLWMSKVVI